MHNKFNDELFTKLQDVINKHKNDNGPLMPILQAAQGIFGYLPYEVQDYIAKGLGIPLSEVYGVATFYSQFLLKPKGKHTINVCLGTACYVKGAQAVLDRLEEALGIKDGQTTDDGKFSIVGTRCLGCCGLAPVIMIDDTVYGNLTADDIPRIISKY